MRTGFMNTSSGCWDFIWKIPRYRQWWAYPAPPNYDYENCPLSGFALHFSYSAHAYYVAKISLFWVEFCTVWDVIYIRYITKCIMLNFSHLNPLTPSGESCSDLAEIFSMTSFNYLKNILFYTLIFYLALLKSY